MSLSFPGDSPSVWPQNFADPSNPTYEECRALGFHYLKPGKQCPHPANVWFRDPRASPPPLRPRKAILRDIFRDHSTSSASPRTRAILAHYVEPDEPSSQTTVSTPSTFPQFPLLPAELREQIWQLALPRRTIDLREIRHARNYIGIRNVALPVPQLAHVCREARAVVQRLGVRLSLAWIPAPATKALLVRPVGFFVRGSDVALHMPGPELGDDDAALARVNKAPAAAAAVDAVWKAQILTASSITRTLRCDAAAVHWAGRARRPLATTRDPVTQFMPLSAAQSAGGSLRPWLALKDAGPALRTVYVFYRSRFVEVSLLVDREFPAGDGEEDDIYAVARMSVEVQLLVDLYDDHRLAELSTLETLNADGDNDKPRFASPGARNPGLCLNCERVHWEQNQRKNVLCQWLQLFEDELDAGMVDEVFVADETATGLPYNPDHPWVQEKLRSAPEFRPAVLVHLQVAEQARLQAHDQSLQEQVHHIWADSHGPGHGCGDPRCGS
ncbi:hypothetical protein B0T22DRAFT_484801 [Podospora appendiculata]|uniref:2EXR domain-containing protein n=1 Tax=Podospora appendiculata TaxID=314037 RepID=A0AAE0X1F2_9PEZI|nr:hypothetical protein B0T22DRAFT_484801 [Podospora appendiculata]